MPDSQPRDPAPTRRAPSLRVPALLVLTALAALPASSANAQRVRPWVPPGADSLVQWVADARVAFQGNSGDSIGGKNYRAYEQVGNLGRRLLRGLGRQNMIQARAVEALLDSLGLDTDISIEPDLPYFALLMVRNPFRPDAKAVGFLYWFRGDDLRMQGAQFSGGHHPKARVWWTGNQEAPYSWGVVDFTRTDAAMHFTLFRLSTKGLFWTIAQYEDSGYKLGGSGAVSWTDVNGDLKPELIAWIPGEKDSMFEECSGCPKLINELLFAERPNGFKLQDTRIVPSPYSTFALFIRMLTEGSKTQAARLLKDPKMVDRAIAAGWATRRNRIWKVENAEPGTTWPEWLFMRFRGTPARAYMVEFEMVRGRWVIKDWGERRLDSVDSPPATSGQGAGKP